MERSDLMRDKDFRVVDSAKQDWYDIFDELLKGEGYDKNLFLANLSENERKYYTRTVMKAYNSPAIFGPHYEIEVNRVDGQVETMKLHYAIARKLLQKADIICKIKRADGRLYDTALKVPWSKDQLEQELVEHKKEEGGIFKRLTGGKKDGKR